MKVVTPRFISWLLTLSLALLTVACNGSSEDSDGDDNTGPYNLSLSYNTVVNNQCSEPTDAVTFKTTESICVVAKLTQGGSPSNGKIITFSNTLGQLTPVNALTENGVAHTIISNPEQLGAGTVTAQFDTGELENNLILAQKHYQFIATEEDSANINASILKEGVAVTQFKVDETVQLQAQFINSDSTGIANQLVTFTAGNASLTPNTALTNNQGIAQISYTPSVTDIGAANLNVSLDYQQNPAQNYQSNLLYEVLPTGVIEDDGVIKLGHFDSNDQFIEGVLGTALPAIDGQYIISAGGNIGVTATIVTETDDGSISRIQTPTSISFSSDCVLGGHASIDSPVSTLSGTASSTFQNSSCSGNSQRDDLIVATVQSGNQTVTASLPIILESQTIVSLNFISAEPTNIRIKGAGGTASSESSLVTFQVMGSDNQPVAQQDVHFSLDTHVGGLNFAGNTTSTVSGSNAEGLVSVRVNSGTMPTPVRVLARIQDSDGNTLVSSQSEQLTVNTGLPQQLGFTLSPTLYNPEADLFDGEPVTLTVFAADSFGNPAPDDTTINFTSEGGHITPSCLTVNGQCSVEWLSANPRVPDHRITVLAYALGHETFFDTNGNNIFDEDDGSSTLSCYDTQGTLQACSGNGMDIEAYRPNGFSDLPDTFRDDNENGIHDDGEKYFSTTNSPIHNGPDGKFNGPQCQEGLALCGIGAANKAYIRKALVMTMSGSHAHFTLWQDGNLIVDDSGRETAAIVPLTAIAAGGSSIFTVRFYDSAYQMMPANSQLAATSTNGSLDFSDTTGVANRTHEGGSVRQFVLTNEIDPSGTGEPSLEANVSFTVTTPKDIQSAINFVVPLTGT